jgi:hypothetical protein
LAVEINPESNVGIELLIELAINPMLDWNRESGLLGSFISQNIIIVPATIFDGSKKVRNNVMVLSYKHES